MSDNFEVIRTSTEISWVFLGTVDQMAPSSPWVIEDCHTCIRLPQMLCDRMHVDGGYCLWPY